jgi:putative hydrolase of the HAD superfamily
MHVKAVFLDLDGTLLNYDGAAWAQTVRAVCARLGRADHSLDTGRLGTVYTELSTSYFRAFEASGEQTADGHAIWRNLWRTALAECGSADEAVADAATTAYAAERADRYELFADVLPTLALLRDQVGALVLITNGPGSAQRHKASSTGLTELLDAVIISGEAGVAKPDPAIFALAAEAAGVPLAAAWHVGDSLAADVAGARNASLGAGVWLDRSGRAGAGSSSQLDAPRPDYAIASLSELPALLR